MSNSPPTITPAPAGPHPSVDTWIDYYARKVPERQAEGLREHLGQCRRCVDLVLDLDRFAEPSPAAGGVADFERAAVWRAVKHALAPRISPGARHWPTVAAIAASAVFAVFGFSQYTARVELQSRVASQHAELSGLQPIAEIEDLRPGARERSYRGGVDPTVDLDAEAGTVALILNLEDEVDFPAYELRVFDAAGVRVTTVSDLVISDFGNFGLAVPPGALAPGTYELRLFGRAGDREQLLEVYPISLR